MIAGLFPAARLAVDAGGLQLLSQRRGQQSMIDADAGVAGERIPPIMPEGVDPFVGKEVADGVGPALRDQLAIFLPRFRSEQRVLGPALGLVHVHVRRNNVIVSDQQRRQPTVEQLLRVLLQRVEPSELVVELRPRPRIAVRREEVADEYPADRRLDVAALLEVWVA